MIAISARGKKNRKVRAARAASGRARWRRLCKLGLKNQGTRLVYAGILPHSTFGAALHAPAKADIVTAQLMMGGVGLKKPLGTSCNLVQAVDRPGRAAKFVYIKEAVARWAREVWLLGSAVRPEDALTAKEIVRASEVIQGALDSGEELVNGPLWAIRCAFKELGWAMHGGGSAIRVMTTGEIILLNLTSPREVVRKAWEGWQSGLFGQEFGRLAARRGALGDHGEHEWCQQLVRDLVLTEGFDGRARAIALQLLAGTVPTGSWLNAHGWQTEGLCGCGASDTLAHRLGGCTIREGCPIVGIRSYKDFWALLDTPPCPENP